MAKKSRVDYKKLLKDLNELEKCEYPISPEITNLARGLVEYDKNSGIIGVCHLLGMLSWQLRMSFDITCRPFVSDHGNIQTDKDRYALTLLHLVLKHIKQLFTEYDGIVVRILNCNKDK